MTIILAKFLGLYFLAIGIAFILNPNRLKTIYKQINLDQNFLLFGGVIALLIGAFIISVHNVWVANWPVIITILGWWSLIKGFALVAYPDFIRLYSFLENKSDNFYRILGVVLGMIGLFLTYQGFIA